MAGSLVLGFLLGVAAIVRAEPWHEERVELSHAWANRLKCPYGPTLPFCNPEDCTTYFQCVGEGLVELYKCPDDLRFNPALSVCDHPENVDPSSCAKWTTRSLRIGQHPPPACPEDCDGNVLLPNPHDCSTFFKCDAGKAILFHCPDGLEYNKDTQQCDYPELAGCSRPRQPPREVYDSPKPQVTETFPNPHDCSTFYVRTDGREPVLSHCPHGLHYNAKSGYCDFPENAGCQVHYRPPVAPVVPPAPVQPVAYTHHYKGW